MSWPVVRFEELVEKPEPSNELSHRMNLAARAPFQSAVPAPIAKENLVLESSLVSELEDVLTELVKFDHEVANVVAPFSSLLLRTESAASSEVEKLTASAKALGLAELGAKSSANAELVVDNVRAMQAAILLSDRLSADSIIEMHSALLTRTRPEICGSFRDRAVWIGGSAPSLAHYVAPRAELVPELVEDLVVFAQRTDLPLIAQIAIAHAQFETIHPFVDGNGRTGRALVHGMLKQFGVVESSTLPLSAGLLMDTGNYFKALDRYRDGDPLPIISVFAQASRNAISSGRRLALELMAIQQRWGEVVFRTSSTADSLRTLLFQQPVINAARVSEALGVSIPSANRGISQVLAAGILKAASTNKRNRIFVAYEVIDAMERFAASARRGSA